MPTKKELAAQYRALEEQINRLKNRLNGQVFKKTRHGYRLDRLSESARELKERIGQIEASMRSLVAQNTELLRETDALREKKGVKKRLKAQLKQLSSEVEGLYHHQQQLRQALQQGGQAATQIANLRDDLRRESDDLNARVRDLEENSSRAAATETAQQQRLEALEGGLAELSRAQQNLEEASKSEQTSLQRELDDAILPMQAALQQLEAQSADETARLAEAERQLDLLQRAQDAVDEAKGRLEREQQEQQRDFTERMARLERDTSTLTGDMAALQQQQQTLAETAQLRQPSPDPEVQEALQAQAREHDSRLDALTQRLDMLQRKLSDDVELAARLDRIEQQGVPGLDQIRDQLRQLTRARPPESDSRLAGLEAELGRLNEANEFLQERYRGLGSMELGLTSRLDALQQSLDQQGSETAALEHKLGQFGESLQHHDQQLRAQIEALHEENRERHAAQIEQDATSDRLAQKLDEIERMQPQLAGSLDRIEQSAGADRERLSQLEAGLATVRDDSDRLTRELEEKIAAGSSIIGDLESAIALQQERQQAQTELTDLQTDELASLTERARSQQQTEQEQDEALARLTERSDKQDAAQQTLDAQLQQVRQWADEQGELQQQISAAVEGSRKGLEELQNLGLQSNERIASLEQEQQSLQQQREQDAPLLDEHSRTLQLVGERLDGVGSAQADQQRQIDGSASRERGNRIALAALLLLGLLGGVALYFANTAEIAKSEQRVTQRLLTPDPRYATAERLTAAVRALETSQADNRNRIEALQQASSAYRPERQDELAQRLARLESRLNLLSVGTAPAATAAPDLQRLQSDIQALRTRLGSLSAATGTPAGDSVNDLNARIDALGEAAEERLVALEEAQRALQSANAAGTDTAIDADAIDRRIEALESASANAQLVQRQLRGRMEEMLRSLATLERRIVDPTVDADTLWRNAGTRGRYTIQLAGARTLDSLQLFAKRLPGADEHAFYRTTHLGDDWYILLYGVFTGVSDAKAALASLPDNLQRYRPWVRKVPDDYTYIDR